MCLKGKSFWFIELIFFVIKCFSVFFMNDLFFFRYEMWWEYLYVKRFYFLVRCNLKLVWWEFWFYLWCRIKECRFSSWILYLGKGNKLKYFYRKCCNRENFFKLWLILMIWGKSSSRYNVNSFGIWLLFYLELSFFFMVCKFLVGK